MDEFNVLALIAEGEATGRVDYKRELHLESAEDKAEFVKDIISLANSAPGNAGYLVIGVNNDRYVVGSEEVEEERIQQIVHRYIRPPVVVTCYMVPMHMPGCRSVGVIEVEGLERPHRMVRDIVRLRQDQVFVRHGSVVGEATPEEIRRMQEETEERRRGSRLVEAAKTHLGLGNFEEAIEAYTQGIKLMPTAALFLARGKAYRLYIKERKSSRSLDKELAKYALKDLSDAIRLTDLDELEKEARLERLRVFDLAFVEYEVWGEDVEWLKNNTEGSQLGEVLYLEYQAGEDRVGLSSMEPEEVLTAMDEATHLGYTEPGVYDLRARASFYLFNYGIALQYVNEAIRRTVRLDEQIDRLAFRANIQVRMRQFEEAHNTLLKARQLSLQSSSEEFHGPWAERITSGIEKEIVWRYGLESKFGQIEPHPATALLSVLIAHMASKRVVLPGKSHDGKVVESSTRLTGKAWIERDFAPIVQSIKEIVGEGFWDQCEHLGRRGRLCWELEESD